MRGITLWQPWASLVAFGLKQYETRHWYTSYRGPLLIHAAKRKAKPEDLKNIVIGAIDRGATREQLELLDQLYRSELPLGAIVALTELTDCLEMSEQKTKWQIHIPSQTAVERLAGNWKNGRFAWKLENIRALPEPIIASGKQGFWIPTKETMEGISI